mmetsp:Transcript_10807/g.24238  ORF Transcript_10807/g.24238 Transcript_10807/m.24238 type:complete len:90 (+) Transcript_10807:352-621(+)
MATCDPLLVLNFNYVPPALLAPTNEAFDKLSTEQVDYLVNNVPELSKILTYHVIGGETFADDIPFGMSQQESSTGIKDSFSHNQFDLVS